MIAHAILYGIALAGNCAIVSGAGIFSPLKVDPASVRLYKTGPRSNDLEYAILKRAPQDAQESPDSKERRSQMGSSFIRFGRNHYEGNLENADYTGGNEILDLDSGSSASASRTARGRSDVIIRFGRSELKNLRATQHQPSSGDVKILKYGGKPIEALHRGNDWEQLAVVCSNILASSSSDGSVNDVHLDLAKFVRLCNSLGLGVDENYEARRNSKIIEILEDPSQGETLKHE